MKITEGMLQYELNRIHNFKPLYTNVTTGCNEWDALYITEAGYAYGYEIKLSLSDFKADLKKHRHSLLLNHVLKMGRHSLGISIKHFYYVISGFDLKPSLLPEYSGLMEHTRYGIKIIKAAPTLWRDKVDVETLNNLNQTFARRHMKYLSDKNYQAYTQYYAELMPRNENDEEEYISIVDSEYLF